MQGMSNTELQFEIAMRDQVIYNQRAAQTKLWNLLLSLGLDEKQILDLAAKRGITIEDQLMTPQLKLSDRTQPQNMRGRRYTSVSSLSTSRDFTNSSGGLPHDQYFCARPFIIENQILPQMYCREEHHSSYQYSHDYSLPAYTGPGGGEYWSSSMPSSQYGVPDKHLQAFCSSHMQTRSQFPP